MVLHVIVDRATATTGQIPVVVVAVGAPRAATRGPCRADRMWAQTGRPAGRIGIRAQTCREPAVIGAAEQIADLIIGIRIRPGIGLSSGIVAGCLEAIASGTAIARRAREEVSSNKDTMLRLVDPSELTAKIVSEMAYRGDQLAGQILREAAIALGTGMANLALLFNPQRIIIGGGLSKAGPLLWEPMLETVRARAMAPCQQDLEIVPAGLGDDSGIFGGLAVAIKVD